MLRGLCSPFFSTFSVVITSLREEKERDGHICASRAFVCLMCTRYFLSFSCSQLRRSWGEGGGGRGILVWASTSVRLSFCLSVCLSVCPSLRFAYRQKILKFVCRISMKNNRTHILFLFRRTFRCRVMPLFRRFFFFILPLLAYGTLSSKYLENRLSKDHDIVSQSVDHLINFWQNSINNWLNYVSFPTLAFRTVKQSCQQNI